MRLPRMTTRRWMVVVLIIGLLIGGSIAGVRLKRRRDYFLSQVQYHAEMASWYRDLQRLDLEEAQHREHWFDSMKEVERLVEIARSQAAHLRKGAVEEARKAAHHTMMAHKYNRAARYPWLPVAPDPSELK